MDKTLLERLNNSIIIVNKPPGLTSHEVTTLIKKITGAKRAGHAGTLDPEVSGVLPVALGRATKLIQYIAGKNKTYVGIAKFKNIPSLDGVTKLFKEFTGEIIQTPPKLSAVKKVPRKRKIHALKILEIKDRLVLFETNVDAGTYIRTLCEDMGKRCGGARMEELRRIAVGKINENIAVKMEDVVDAIWVYKNKNDPSLLLNMLKSPEMLLDLPKVVIKESAVKSVRNGAQIMIPALERVYGSPTKGDSVAIYCQSKFIGVGKLLIAEEELVKKTKGFAIKIERIHN